MYSRYDATAGLAGSVRSRALGLHWTPPLLLACRLRRRLGAALGKLATCVGNLWNRGLALTQEASDSPTAKALRPFIPRFIRSRLNQAKNRVKSTPVRLVLPISATDDPVRVVVFGTAGLDWLPRLSDPATWRALPNVVEVLVLPEPARHPITPPRDPRACTVLIPLSEKDILARPPTVPALAPASAVVELLRDKVAFAAHVERLGLAAVCPRVYRSPAEIGLPCIVKPAVAAYGTGIRILRSKAELDSFLAQEGWDPARWICQEFIAADIEYSTHCVLERGRVLWFCSFAFERREGADIRCGIEFATMRPFTAPAAVLEAIARLLAPLDYSGPCAVDYTVRDDGRIALFEINPRFGGSLMIPENGHHLQAALACIIERAAA